MSTARRGFCSVVAIVVGAGGSRRRAAFFRKRAVHQREPFRRGDSYAPVLLDSTSRTGATRSGIWSCSAAEPNNHGQAAARAAGRPATRAVVRVRPRVGDCAHTGSGTAIGRRRSPALALRVRVGHEGRGGGWFGRSHAELSRPRAVLLLVQPGTYPGGFTNLWPDYLVRPRRGPKGRPSEGCPRFSRLDRDATARRWRHVRAFGRWSGGFWGGAGMVACWRQGRGAGWGRAP